MQVKKNALRNEKGNIEVICGPMFAGKSEELLRRLNRLKYASVSYLIFKPKLDFRFGNKVKSRDGREIEAIEIVHPYNVFEHLHKVTSFPFVVAFDEAQFFSEEIVDVIKVLSNEQIQIIIAGLDTDINHQPFGSMGKILAIANDVKKLTAICMKCGNDASRTQWISDRQEELHEQNVIVIGDTDKYEARCNYCHENVFQPSKDLIKNFEKHKFNEHLKILRKNYKGNKK